MCNDYRLLPDTATIFADFGEASTIGGSPFSIRAGSASWLDPSVSATAILKPPQAGALGVEQVCQSPVRPPPHATYRPA
jgi:hypothetical protein